MNDAAAEGADGHGWMSGETSGGASKRKRGTVMTAVVVVAAVAIAALELFVLEGEAVFDARLDAGREVQVEIPLDRVGEPHLLEIYNRRKNKLSVTLAAPSGEVVAELDEFGHHKRHFVAFTPEVAGVYVLEGSQRSRSTVARTRVQVFVNDRRWFGPWAYALGY